MKDLKSRYLNDPTFHTVVEHMRAIIRSAMLTPSEVREAAMTACVIEEMHAPRPPLSTSDEYLERVREAIARYPLPHPQRVVATDTVTGVQAETINTELRGRPGTRDVQSRPFNHNDGGEGKPKP